MNTYKHKFFKNKLNLEKGENLPDNSYEEYARKTVKIVPVFYNPQKIVFDSILISRKFNSN